MVEKSKMASETLINLIFLMEKSFFRSMQGTNICSLPKSHFKVMVVLKKLGQQNLKSIAEQLGIAVPNASKILRDLEEKKLVNRDIPEENRRVTFFTLSEEGQELLKQAKEKIRQNIENTIVSLDSNDISKLNESLIIVNELFNKALSSNSINKA